MHTRGDDGVVVGHFRRVEHLLALRQLLPFKRGGQCGIVAKPLQYGGTFRVDVVAKEGGVHTRIGGYLLLVERLDEAERVVGRVAELLVALHLQGGQVEQAWWSFSALLGRYVGDGEGMGRPTPTLPVREGALGIW